MTRIACLLLLACNASTPAVAPIALSGVAGNDGATGPLGELRAGALLAERDGVLSIAASGCADGAVLLAQGGAVRCGSPRVSATSLQSANGLQFDRTGGDVTVSLRFGNQATDARRGDHTHIGETFTSANPGATLTIEQLSTDRGVTDRFSIGLRAENVAANDLDNDVFRAAVIGYNTASRGGVGVLGDTTQGHLFGDGVAGQTNGAGSDAVFGEARGGSGSAGVRGETASANARGILARAPTGTALLTQGASDFGSDGVLLPLVSASGPIGGAVGGTSLAVCPDGYLAMTGGCSIATALDHAELMNKTTGSCGPGGFRGNQVQIGDLFGFDAYCCRGNGVKAVILCLRVEQP